MFFRRRIKKAEDAATERRHLEDIGWARKGIELAKQNRNLQVVAIFVAVLGIIVAVVSAWPASPSQASGKTRITLIPLLKDAILPHSVSRVPPPPAYPGNETADHCALWWKKWFIRQQASAYPSNVLVEVSAPADADATITSARLSVFRSYKPPAISFIRCFTGGGPVPGTLLNINLDHPGARPTIVSESGQAVPLAMPDAVINIAAGHTEYLDISPSGSGRIYEWSITLSVVVDQHSTFTVFGSRQHPMRSWLGAPPSPAYDYSVKKRAWYSLH